MAMSPTSQLYIQYMSHETGLNKKGRRATDRWTEKR